MRSDVLVRVSAGLSAAVCRRVRHIRFSHSSSCHCPARRVNDPSREEDLPRSDFPGAGSAAPRLTLHRAAPRTRSWPETAPHVPFWSVRGDARGSTRHLVCVPNTVIRRFHSVPRALDVPLYQCGAAPQRHSNRRTRRRISRALPGLVNPHFGAGLGRPLRMCAARPGAATTA
jgi:hypothetical protein